MRLACSFCSVEMKCLRWIYMRKGSLVDQS